MPQIVFNLTAAQANTLKAKFDLAAEQTVSINLPAGQSEGEGDLAFGKRFIRETIKFALDKFAIDADHRMRYIPAIEAVEKPHSNIPDDILPE